jgi:hypothetical protein
MGITQLSTFTVEDAKDVLSGDTRSTYPLTHAALALLRKDVRGSLGLIQNYVPSSRYDRLWQLALFLYIEGKLSQVRDSEKSFDERAWQWVSQYLDESIRLALACTERWEMISAIAVISGLASNALNGTEVHTRCQEAVGSLAERLQDTTYGRQHFVQAVRNVVSRCGRRVNA